MPDTKVEVPEVEEQGKELTAEELAAQEASALAAQKEGYNEEAVTPPVAAKTAKAADSKPDQAKQPKSDTNAGAEAKAKAEADAKAAAEAEAKKAEQEAERARLKALGFYTQADVDELLKKHSIENSRVFGKFGSIEQRLTALAAKSEAGGIEVTAEDVADLQAQFGPELADAMLKTLTKVVGKGRVAAEPGKEAAVAKDLAALQAEYEGKLTKATEATKTELTREFEKRTLAITHEDWKEVTGVYDAKGSWIGYQPAFEAWMNTLPVDEQAKLRDGWDALFVSKKLTEYKNHVKAQAEAVAQAAAKPAPKPVVPSRVRQAVVTDGSATPTGSTLTAKDYQRQGYNEA